ncbi:hypothetical protein AVEN_183062-1 [Araneus ventricosus]|uniref:Uncharacterized protein n=1 Tax=Araneus ventricosus TaxID=182803 RepID=A0A4Y2X033_ARAVE|nr:hypothetical protein AVEN_183062-1 [Araneus ventricosus]
MYKGVDIRKERSEKNVTRIEVGCWEEPQVADVSEWLDGDDVIQMTAAACNKSSGMVVCAGGLHVTDLNPLDFFLWGYIKQRVYATPPPTLQELRNRITDACASVSPAMLYNVQREVQSRVQMCIVAEGHHFEHDR